MPFNLGGGYAAGGGADALESLWQLLAQQKDAGVRQQQEGQRIKIAQQSANDNSELRRMEVDARAEQRAAQAKLQAQQGAGKLASNLSIGQELNPSAVGALNAGDLGDLVKAPTLDSRNISGTLRMLASTPNPGKGPSFLGTPGQRDDAAQDDELDRQATLNPQLRGRLAMLKTLDRDKRGAAITEVMREAAKPASTPILRVGRNGTVQTIGDAPAGAHIVNEPTPTASAHGRFSVTQGADAAGKPVMIRTNVDSGEVTVLPMPEGVNFAKREQPATQDQTNASIYSSRMEQAEPTLKTLESTIATMNPLSYMAQSKIDNPALQSKEMQAYSQSARQFINSVLRRESGAAISAGEFDSARKQYLPMPGDTAQTLQLKASARSRAISDLQKAAGPAYRKPDAGGDTKPASSGFKVTEIKP